MAMKVDYGMVRKVTMIFKFEDFILCFDDWSSLCNALPIVQERKMSGIVNQSKFEIEDYFVDNFNNNQQSMYVLKLQVALHPKY
jgi:hypothetical protein